jgi:hypothetical protein
MGPRRWSNPFNLRFLTLSVSSFFWVFRQFPENEGDKRHGYDLKDGTTTGRSASAAGSSRACTVRSRAVRLPS